MEIVELRVHGVHGTSPGTMLGLADGEVGQVAGDKLTGIYRPKDGVKLPYRNLEGKPVSVEAYSWGALTSGIQGFLGWVKRALWLLLLPFAMANLAYWARLELARPTGQSRWGARAVRLSGLLLTVFIVLTPCVIAIDMVAWQCYRRNVPGCARIPDQLDFLAGWDPAQRIAAATLVPVLVVLILWLLSKKSLARYECVGDPIERQYTDDEPVLVHPKLWDGLQRTLRLQRLHIVIALCTIIGFSGWHVLHETPGDVTVVFLTTITSTVLAVLATFLTCVNHEDDLENLRPRDRWAEQFAVRIGDRVRRLDDAFYRGMALAAVLAYLVHLAALASAHPEFNDDADYFGHNVWFIGVFVALTVLHLSVFVGGRMPTFWAVSLVVAPVCIGALWVTIRYSRHGFEGAELAWGVGIVLVFWIALTLWQYLVAARSNDYKHAAWAGAGASVFLATAAWIALLFTTSIVVAAANYLNGPDHGVSDLVSTVEERDDEPAPEGAIPPPNDEGGLRYVATGDVVLRGGWVEKAVSDGDIVVKSGTVEMEGLSLDEGGQSDFTEGLGETLVKGVSAELVVAGTQVRLEDACFGTSRGVCTAEDDEFHVAGVLNLAADMDTITIDPGDDGHVVLEPSQQPEFPLVVPQVLIWTPMAQLAWLLFVTIGLGYAVSRFRRKVAPAIKQTFDVDPPVQERDRFEVLKARKNAALAHRAETLLDLVGAITAPIALVTIVLSMSGRPPWELDGGGWTRPLATVSMYVVLGMSAGLVLLGSQIRRSENTRKAVGVIWDLTTFWPRTAHPLAPPCYAERVIPELELRTHWALDRDEQNVVILSGHSQGSLIVASMASRLKMRDLARLRIITYGSQIRGLYGRIFPRVFGADAIGYTATTERTRLGDPFPDVARSTPAPPPPTDPPAPADSSLRARLSRAGGTWVNLVRRTDYLGYRVFSDRDSVLDIPTPEVPPPSSGDPGPAVMTHSGYQHTLVYRQHVALWTGEEVVPDPEGTTNLTVLPPV